MSCLPPNACRLRVRYVKDGRLAYLGHLEVMETVMRSVRRSGVPFEVSNGFARRMRVQFSQALPVGASSECEYYDLLLSDPLDVGDAMDRLRNATPRALAPSAARILPRRVPALEAWAGLSSWEVNVRAPGVNAKSFDDGLGRCLAADVLHYMRGDKPKSVSLGETLVDYDVRDVSGGIDLAMRTRTGERGSLRPAILVKAVCDCAPLRVRRVGQWHEREDGALVDPMDV